MTYQLVTDALCESCGQSQPLTYDGHEYRCAVCGHEIPYHIIYRQVYPQRYPGDNYCGD